MLKCKYDIAYIKSCKMDFSKIEENQIRDLMLEGYELEYLLSLDSYKLDSMLYDCDEYDCECEYLDCEEGPILNDSFIPEIPYLDEEDEKVCEVRGNVTETITINIRKAKDHLKLLGIDFEGLSKFEIARLYYDNSIIF